MENKKRYGFSPIYKLEEGKYVSAITGWIFENDKRKVEEKEVNGKSLVDFTISSQATESKLKYLGLSGDTMWVKCNAWESVAERLKKLNIRKGFQLLVFGVLQVKEYNGKKFLEMNISDFTVLRFPKKDGNNQEVEQPQDGYTPVGDDEDYGDMPF